MPSCLLRYPWSYEEYKNCLCLRQKAPKLSIAYSDDACLCQSMVTVEHWDAVFLEVESDD
jgi:hypothetical protein